MRVRTASGERSQRQSLVDRTKPVGESSYIPIIQMYFAIARAGFRRYGTYRIALVAAMFANVVFGFLRCSVLLTVAGSGTGLGYSGRQLVTYVWVGQGLIGVVLLWMQPELPALPSDLAELRESPIDCSGACVTMPKCVLAGASPMRSPRRRSTCWMWIRWVSM